MKRGATLLLGWLCAAPTHAEEILQARYAGKDPVEACTEPGGGACEHLRNVKILLGGFANRGGESYSRAVMGDRVLWIRTRDVITMETDLSRARKQQASAGTAACKKRGGATIGMTEEMIHRSCWGQPLRVNLTITSTGRHEQWVYGGSNYLYVDNGILTSIQTTR